MNKTRLGTSALLVTIGAILAWAVTYEVEGVDLNRVGVIVFIAGLALGGYRLAGAAADHWNPPRRLRRRSTAASRNSTDDRKRDLALDG